MKYILKKIVSLIIILLIVSLLAFLAFQVIPGDPTTKILGTEYTPERAAALREAMGLNRPVLVRYGEWLKNFLMGDFGTSYSYSMSVKEMLAGKLPITFTLTAISFAIITVISIPLGIFLAKHEGTWLDKVFTTLNQTIMSIPPFFIGIVLSYIFSIVLRVFVHGNFVSYTVDPVAFIKYLSFPAISIAIPRIAMTVKLLRSSIIGEMDKDYVRTAFSRGNSRDSVLYRHVLKNSIVPVVTFLAVTIADIVAGSIIIEQVFGIPGLGRLLVSSIFNRDFPVVQAIVVILAVLVVVINTLADIINQYIDPRIKLR